MGSRTCGSVQEDEVALGEEGWEAGCKRRDCIEPPARLDGVGYLGKPRPALGKQGPHEAVEAMTLVTASLGHYFSNLGQRYVTMSQARFDFA